MKYDVIVIGGGASGLMAAGRAAERGRSVLVIERNRALGRKLLITGKGRCNVTNAADAQTIMQNTPRNARFLNSALRQLGSDDVMAFFESLGVPLIIERGGRVFPVSEKSSDIVDALVRYCKSGGVSFALNTRVTEISAGRVKSAGGDYRADAIVIATGGKSYPATGSTGDGYRFAKAAGHTILPLKQSLVPLLSDDDFIPSLEGLSLKNVSAKLVSGGKTLHSGFGEMLFTAEGVSGPLVLSASAHMPEGAARLDLDLKPALDRDALDRRLLRDLSENKNKDIANALHGLTHARLLPALFEKSGLAPHIKANSVTKAQRTALIDAVKCFTINISGSGGFSDAVITRGGVCVSEINPKTMESKLVPGIYFTGEVLDVDAYTGGFNLQIAFSTGYAAGDGV